MSMLLLLTVHSTVAAITLDPIFGDDMVLASSKLGGANVWGTGAAPSAKITVTSGSASNSSAADARGAWCVALSVAPSLTPADVTVAMADASDAPPLTVKRVLFGAVVICSGQSNMGVSLPNFGNYTSDPARMNLTAIYAKAASYGTCACVCACYVLCLLRCAAWCASAWCCAVCVPVPLCVLCTCAAACAAAAAAANSAPAQPTAFAS